MILRVLGLAAAVLAVSTTSFAKSPECRATRAQLELGNPLEIAKASIEKNNHIRIVAMGSSSTQGYGASDPKYAYPAQLRMKLEEAVPSINVMMWNKGVGGQDAEEMVTRMHDDVLPEKAHLVIWQIGTNSAIKRQPLDRFANRLRAGIDIGKSLGADFVLMNLQYVPAVVSLPDEEDYARVTAEVAKEKNVGLFNRFDIMRSWYRDGMSYSQFVTSDGLHLNDFGQKCIGKLLSKSLLNTIYPKQLTSKLPQ